MEILTMKQTRIKRAKAKAKAVNAEKRILKKPCRRVTL